MNFFKTFLAGVLAFLVGSFLSLFFWIFMFGMIAGMAASLGGGKTVVRPGTILKIDLAEEIVDSPSTDPFGTIDWMSMSSTKQLSLIKALRAIESAKDDDRIEGIYLRLNGGGGVSGSAIVEELRAAVADFKQSGKFVVSYNEVYSQGQYYLASVADSIYLQPQGGMDWSGLSTTLMFYKGLFDKLDLKAEVFRPTACKYKSAVEPYILTKMSDANREQMQQLVNSLWKTIAASVAESRGIDLAELNRIADGLEVSLPEEALEKKFVDGLLFEDQMDDVFAALGVETDKEGDYRFVSLGDYAAQLPADTDFAAPQVAIVYAEGSIVDGEASGGSIGGNSLARALAEVREDDDVKAVVLRVNSPGGSALASDLIWREMELLKAEKPVVVSMGSYAASGGYYISAPADVIVADKMTLTGSIGVFGMYVDKIAALKNKLGITLDGVKSNASAGAGSMAPLTPLERAAIMRGVDKVYETFTSYVAEGRNLPIEKVLDIAGGRVWSGEDALAIGLIDAYGGLDAAIALAADKAEIADNFRVVEKIDQPTGLAAVLAALDMRLQAWAARSQTVVPEAEWRQVREALGQQGIMMYSPYKVELR
ncbi:MAG: signal peptide peptidase SppA [Alistipes sp.]|nr:signal peptide peptidase SppA [Alistipes sp.]MDE7344650.1 signal peptide peptidase SppA [Alistipes sp.]